MVQTASAAVLRVEPPVPARSPRPTASPAGSGPVRSGPGRRTPPRLRAFFLRHLRACGEVKRAAERTGVAVSTLYRWRDRDDAFRARWDSLAEQRRQLVEDRLMGLALEGEKTAVFHKGEQVGWRHSHTARAAIALLAYFDRREKAARLEASQDDDREDDWDDDAQSPEVDGWAARAERTRERALASRSEAATEPKERAGSDSSPAEGPRKIGNGPALPAFDRDAFDRARASAVTPAATRARAPSPPSPPPQQPVSRLPDGRPGIDAATQRRLTQELLDLHYPHRQKPEMLPDNWKPYGMG